MTDDNTTQLGDSAVANGMVHMCFTHYNTISLTDVSIRHWTIIGWPIIGA